MEISDSLKQFIAEQAAVFEKEVHADTCIESDLWVTGDDALEFLIAFSKKFGVIISEFNFDKYFFSEADQILLPRLISRIFSIKRVHNLTVGNLQTAINQGKLNEETVNQS
jgi:acyl carrier protein